MKSSILVSGLINIETTLQVERFPVEYEPVRYPYFGINNTISGVGYNVAKALHTLGSRVKLLSMVGRDFAGELAIKAIQSEGLPTQGVITALAETPQSVILYDRTGARIINTDLKDIQEHSYPPDLFLDALKRSSLTILCNINFSRPFLQAARRAGVMAATDVHALSSLDDEYNRDFMAAADILFLSDEKLPCQAEEMARQIFDRFGPEIVVIGLGEKGALLADRRMGILTRFPALSTRPVVSAIGAGDALFSAFVHFYHETGDPIASIRKAIVFASYKIGEAGAAQGFLTESALNDFLFDNKF